MKHYSASLEQGAQVDLGSITITAGDSLISENTTLTGANRAIILEGESTDYVSGNGEIIDNPAFDAAVLGSGATLNMLTFSRIGTGADVVIDLNNLELGVDTNDTAGRLPIAVDASGGTDVYTGTADSFADSSLSQSAANGLVSAAAGLTATTGDITATLGNIAATAGNLSAGGTLSITGTSTLTGAVTNTVLASSADGVVIANSAGTLRKEALIPANLLPDIAIGDVYSFSSSASTSETAALNLFYAETPAGGNLSNTSAFNVGDIACIDYDSAGQSVTLLYVGAADNAGPTTAADWKNISSSADGIIDVISGSTDQISVTGVQTKTVTALTGAVADGAMTLVTGDQVHDYLVDTAIQLTGDVVAADTDLTIGGTTMLSTSLAIDTVDLAEINAAQDATPLNDAGKVLTINSAGTGLVWMSDAGGSVRKIAMDFTSATNTGATGIILTSLIGPSETVPQVTVTVFETSGTVQSQIIPESVTVDSSDNSLKVEFGKSGNYKVVVTG